MNKILSILLLLSLAAALPAQRAFNVTAWIDIQMTDENAVISCWCQNHSSSPLHLSYKAVLMENDSTVAQGKTLALPDQPNLLLNANFLVRGGQFKSVTLHVYQNSELIATANAVGPEPLSTLSQSNEQAKAPNDDRLKLEDIEIEGLVIDETRTKLAHDFYELFYNGWTSIEEDVKTNYSITIREQPALIGNGSRIMVVLDGEELTLLNLQPRAELLESLAMQLVESLYNQIVNPEQNYQEIGTEDISGSGIY